ncbi:hypothetical protein STRDD11_01039 [Streptococcus sp. DD11]|nr:hypothetical protein STRDD11_01039 [Streptococcus sp. DD11]
MGAIIFNSSVSAVLAAPAWSADDVHCLSVYRGGLYQPTFGAGVENS